MDLSNLYGTVLCLEVYEAIRKMKAAKKRATNRSIRDHILEKYEIQLIGNQKENFTRRITSFTNMLTEAGYLSRQRKNSVKYQTTYYEYRISIEGRTAENVK